MEASFEDFVRSRGPALLRYAHLLCGDGGRAEDLVQDALVKVHQPTAYCAEQHTVLASLTLSITGPDAPATTRQPAGTPDPVQTTILYTQNGTLTSTVVSGPAPSDGETVTQTVGR